MNGSSAGASTAELLLDHPDEGHLQLMAAARQQPSKDRLPERVGKPVTKPVRRDTSDDPLAAHVKVDPW
jgi:hypothetical protein